MALRAENEREGQQAGKHDEFPVSAHEQVVPVACPADGDGAQELRASVVGLLLWTGALFACRLMAAHDPRLRQVYLRHRRYRRYYAARSTPFRVNTGSQGRQYK